MKWIEKLEEGRQETEVVGRVSVSLSEVEDCTISIVVVSVLTDHYDLWFMMEYGEKHIKI
ncbi:hypothetical protein J2X69_000962 [Algoriphagus sp. 4150]|uniref:hypothetical protein n=1 Tax=Algoriphagus sp. 4150 TaxID=2817756 RepID=UPI0028624200|nr:hypothetical protein [Algoriphagus sp. 4150]MDR7128630.1 hypothetical protein [Algoriphagus sp. 4150]